MVMHLIQKITAVAFSLLLPTPPTGRKKNFELMHTEYFQLEDGDDLLGFKPLQTRVNRTVADDEKQFRMRLNNATTDVTKLEEEFAPTVFSKCQ